VLDVAVFTFTNPLNAHQGKAKEEQRRPAGAGSFAALPSTGRLGVRSDTVGQRGSAPWWFTWPSTVTVAPNGDVYVAYHSQPDLNDTNVEGATTSAKNPSGMSGQTIVFRSTNGGDKFLQRSVPFTQSESDITYNRQDGTSRTIPGTKFWTMGSAQPWIVADPVRPGNIYVITADDSGDGVGTFDAADVVMATSTNNGQTWSRQFVDSGIVLPGGGSRSFQLFPTASIDQSGDIVVAWYDNRSGLTNSGGNYLLDVYARYSKDGGVTWSNAFQVNTTHFDPDAGAQTRFNGPPATTRIGEYFGIAINNGTAYVAWNGNRFDNTGTPIGQQVYMGSFQLNGSLNVDQPNATGSHTVTIQPLAGAPTNNYIEITDTTDASGASVREYVGMGNSLSDINLNDRSSAFDTVNVAKTYSSNNVHIAFEDGGGTVVISPFDLNLDTIAGPVNVSSNFGVGTTLYIDDGNNPRAGDAWTFSSGNINRAGAANISFQGLDFVDVVFGSGQGAKYDVEGTTSHTFTEINTAINNNEIDVRATSPSGPLAIVNRSGVDTITLGSLAPATGGTMANIQGNVSVECLQSGDVNLILDDSGDAAGKNITVGDGVAVGDVVVTGLAPAEIDYSLGQFSTAALAAGGGPDTFTVTSPAAAIDINGGGGADTLVGPDAPNAWNLRGPGTGTVGSVAFEHMEVLRGGSQADVFHFRPGGSVPVMLDGGGGTNTLDYSGDGSVPATVNLQTGSATGINGGDVGGLSNIQVMVGSVAGGDTLIGPDAASTWYITGANVGRVGGFNFLGVKSVRGGSQNDVFRITPSGSLAGSVDGGGGTGNTLDYSTDGGAAATVNLQTHAATRLHAGALGAFQHIQGFIGSTAAGDQLIGPNATTLWQVTGGNAGQAGAFSFAGFKNLQGGTASDTFKFSPAGVISGSINGGGGGDWLDYSLFTTGVSVNLTAGAASRVAGGAAGKLTQIQNVIGGGGNNTLIGNAQGNILIGGGGTNVIQGGSGRSILIGGTGKATIAGGSGDDILIAGTTTFDANEAALMTLLKEWQRTDKTYAERISDLRTGAGFAAGHKLIRGTTVLDNDTASATLTGGAGLDWFFANLGPGGVVDHITDLNNGGPEQVN
jgi:hypothetical protein